VAKTPAKRRSASKTRPKASASAKGSRPAAAKTRVRVRNQLGEAWLRERERRAQAKPGAWKRQAAVGGGVLAGMVALTIWLGGFGDDAVGRAGRMTTTALIDAGFTLDHVEVRGARRAQAEEVANQLMLEPGEYIFNFDPRAAKERVEMLSWVEEAKVLRLLPNRVVVMVTEREPLARWEAPEGEVVLDSGGAVVGGADPANHAELPLLEGAAAPEAAEELIQALARHPMIARRAAAFERVGGRRWDMKMNDGLVVRLPETGVDAALTELADMQARDGVLDLPLSLVDMRGGALVMRPRPMSRRRVGREA
jgi:cell division protein FtsQ